eukprot:scaffold7216_cov160-Skeletonema_marinoi.AAC.13
MMETKLPTEFLLCDGEYKISCNANEPPTACLPSPAVLNNGKRWEAKSKHYDAAAVLFFPATHHVRPPNGAREGIHWIHTSRSLKVKLAADIPRAQHNSLLSCLKVEAA